MGESAWHIAELGLDLVQELLPVGAAIAGQLPGTDKTHSQAILSTQQDGHIKDLG